VKRALTIGLLLGAAVALVLVLRSRQAAADGARAGGTGVIEGVEVNVTSRLSTRILRVDAQEGELVKEGQVLVELDCAEAEASLAEASARRAAAEASIAASNANVTSADRTAAASRGTISAAESQLAALEAQQHLARLELERSVSLQQQGAATTATVDDARSRYDALSSQLAAQQASASATREQAGALFSAGSAAKAQALGALANLEAARAAVARAQLSVKECSLLAPRDGQVAARNLEPGESVQPGSVVLVLTDVTEAKTRFYLANSELAAAAPGRRVTVVADAWPGQTFAGTIAAVSPRAEFTPRNVQTREDRERLVYAIEVRVPNAERKLRAGMPVEVSIDGSAR